MLYRDLVAKIRLQHARWNLAISVFKSKKLAYVLRYRPTYDEDGLFTNHNCDFINDQRFRKTYELGFSTGSTKGWNFKVESLYCMLVR